MDPKKESIDQPWNVVGSNDKSAAAKRDNRVANEPRDDRVSVTTDARSPFLRAAKVLPDICDDEDPVVKNDDLADDLKLPSLPEPSHDSSMSTAKEIKDVMKKINPMTNVIVKIFYGQKKLFGFPIIFKKLLDDSKRNGFASFQDLHERIAIHCDDALESRLYQSIFLYDEKTNFGNNIDLRLDSLDDDLGEFHLSKLTYVESICASYHQHGKIVLHVHCHRSPFYDHDPKVQNFDVKQENDGTTMPDRLGVKLESYVAPTHGLKQRVTGHAKYQSPVHLHRPSRHRHSSPNHWSNGSRSPISIYDEADYLVKDPVSIVPFSMESRQMRIDELQSLASTSIPDISSIVKLLKSHNVSYKKGDTASTWYQKLHNFCNIIGVYLTPSKAMDKHSEMGKEWDSGCLPNVLYSRMHKMEKVLSHIVTSPDFFPADMQDELQLNPNPYNFIRLFMATHSHSVPDLSDNVITRPGPMKKSQSLSQYALLWVNYFNDELNVNGVRYTKYRQYGYFMRGLPSRFSPLRKFLDMEFTQNHDKEDNIPITVELRNIPTTIKSLASFHGITLSSFPSPAGQINQLDQQDGSPDDCCLSTNDIKVLSHEKTSSKPNDKKHVQFKDSPLKSALRSNSSNGVQCWLCDGPHTFRQCQELQRMKSVCIKRPNVLKHFQHMLLNKNSAAIKVLLDASEFFDDSEFQGLSGVDAHNDETDNVDELPSSDNDGSTEYVQHLGHTDLNSEDVDFSPFQILALQHDTSQYIRSITSTTIHQLPSVRQSLTPNLIQVDGGADRSTTPHRALVHGLRPPRPERGELTYIKDAGEHIHPILGYGHFQVRCLTHDSKPITIMVPCAYIPSIPSTLVNFRTMPNLLHVDESSNHVMNIAFAYLLLHDDVHRKPYRVTVPLLVHGARLYADVVLERSSPNNHSSINLVNQPLPSFDMISSDARIAIISDEPSKLLWHARLGHLNFRSMASLHLYADGVPKFKQSHVSDNCAECLLSKLRRSPRGHGTVKSRATVHGQVLSADWGFICQNSSDTDRVLRLSSVYGDTSYQIFTCAYTGALYGVCAGSKSVPTKWLHTFFHRISTGARHTSKLVLVDRGSELGRSLEFKKVALFHGYLMPTSGPDKSSMNGLGERPHSTIGDALRSMLHSCGLPFKYWNFAFYHYIRLYNLVPHGDRQKSPFEMIRGYKPDISKLRIFGCDVYIRPPGRRPSKLDRHVIRGRFLGYTSTLKQIYYLEYGTNKIKVAAHARFDEGMASTPLDQLPPFAIQLRKSLGHSVPDTPNEQVTTPDDIDLLSSPTLFPVTFTHRFTLKSSDIHNEFDTLGFALKLDVDTGRCYIRDIAPGSTAATFPRWRTRLIGCFLLSIGDDLVFDVTSAETILSRYLVDLSNSDAPIHLDITFASDKSILRESGYTGDPSPIQLDQICHLSSIIETGEELKYQARIDIDWLLYFDNLVNQAHRQIDTEDARINKLSSPKLTRKYIMGQPDAQQWIDAEFKQLDTHDRDKMYGKPCPRPKYAIVLRSIWTYSRKTTGEYKARQCMDGRPLRHDSIRRLESIYTACISQVGTKIFFATCALLNFVIMDLDAVNAFGQAGSLYEMVHIEIDQQYRTWYKHRYGYIIPDGYVLPVKGSLQGHPDSGEIWQTKVNSILDSYNFTTTTHEPCLYRGTFNGELLLLCRQVDDMLIPGKNTATIKLFVQEIASKLNVTHSEGPSKRFNGLDINQTDQGIKISCETYIDKLRKAHGWNDVSPKTLEPISPSKVHELQSTKGPDINSTEGKELKRKNGFDYRSLIGEIVYAYIICRPDYGFAVSLLSRFNTCPAQCHYDAAKRCLKSLIRNKSEGIWYWRQHPRPDLPLTEHIPRQVEDFELKYPLLKDPFLVSGMCDVSIAPELFCRRSFGSVYVFLANVALILYLAKLQPTVASSTGEGEFIQLVLGGKKVKYVRAVMTQFGFPQNGPSPIFGDNISSIMMANNTRPTDRTRHMDIRWFAIQEWVHVDKDIILIHISGIINPTDAMTKALAWLKHYRHMSRAMGHLGSPFNTGRYKLVYQEKYSIKALFIQPA